jgi:hypothetical protein
LEGTIVGVETNVDEDLVAVTEDVASTVAALPETTMGWLSTGNVHTIDVIREG